jgi:outer membrane protein OmpA-like peptidoglycan-associated protein
VTEYLAQKGVAKGQLQYKGYGKTKPIVPNDTYSRSARAKNQRVEIKVLSLG